ncbi:MAG: hypothetical protein ABR975_13560 [Vulcanimicrobiaceae bacterium]|jgi:hypothetical protein
MNATTPKPISIDELLRSSWQLFRTHPSILVTAYLPYVFVLPLMAWFFISVFGAVFSSGVPNHQLEPQFARVFLPGYFAGAAVLSVLVAIDYLWMFALADGLWTGAPSSLGAALHRGVSRIGPAVVAIVIFLLLEIAAIILAIPTLFLSFLALLLFCMYVLPALVAGRGAVDAFRDSFSYVKRWFGASALTIVVLVAIQYGISLVMMPVYAFVMPSGLLFMPTDPAAPPQLPPFSVLLTLGIAYLILMLVMIAYNGFLAIALTGMYRSLRGLAEQPAGALPTEVPPAGAEA